MHIGFISDRRTNTQKKIKKTWPSLSTNEEHYHLLKNKAVYLIIIFLFTILHLRVKRNLKVLLFNK